MYQKILLKQITNHTVEVAIFKGCIFHELALIFNFTDFKGYYGPYLSNTCEVFQDFIFHESSLPLKISTYTVSQFLQLMVSVMVATPLANITLTSQVYIVPPLSAVTSSSCCCPELIETT